MLGGFAPASPPLTPSLSPREERGEGRFERSVFTAKPAFHIYHPMIFR
jgi:hypothetical protein